LKTVAILSDPGLDHGLARMGNALR
jgi:hypothetical protein